MLNIKRDSFAKSKKKVTVQNHSSNSNSNCNSSQSKQNKTNQSNQFTNHESQCSEKHAIQRATQYNAVQCASYYNSWMITRIYGEDGLLNCSDSSLMITAHYISYCIKTLTNANRQYIERNIYEIQYEKVSPKKTREWLFCVCLYEYMYVDYVTDRHDTWHHIQTKSLGWRWLSKRVSQNSKPLKKRETKEYTIQNTKHQRQIHTYKFKCGEGWTKRTCMEISGELLFGCLAVDYTVGFLILVSFSCRLLLLI